MDTALLYIIFIIILIIGIALIIASRISSMKKCDLCGEQYNKKELNHQIRIEGPLAQFIDVSDDKSVQSEQLREKGRKQEPPFFFKSTCESCNAWANAMTIRFHDHLREQEKRDILVRADQLELAARYEEAAVLYEQAGRWAEAGRVRRMGKTHTVKNVTIDLNDLLSDLRRDGISLKYKCKSCGATLVVDGLSESSGGKCRYCGTIYDNDTLVRLLRNL